MKRASAAVCLCYPHMNGLLVTDHMYLYCMCNGPCILRYSPQMACSINPPLPLTLGLTLDPTPVADGTASPDSHELCIENDGFASKTMDSKLKMKDFAYKMKTFEFKTHLSLAPC